MSTFLFLDDDQNRHDAFRKMVPNGHQTVYVYTAEDAISELAKEAFDVVFLDHDLGGKTFVPSDGPEPTGYTVAKWIQDNQDRVKIGQIIVHSFNQPGAQNIACAIRATKIPVTLAAFGTFKIGAP
jgi:CheY-like chemotaxis protein